MPNLARKNDDNDDIVVFWIGRVVVADARMITQNLPIWRTDLGKIYSKAR